MRRSYRPSPVVWAAGLTMIGLLVILAVLQYRWLGELSSAEKLHMRDRMQSSATRFAREFDRELTRAKSVLRSHRQRPIQTADPDYDLTTMET